jgi:1-acyl-sn-glycerol-3-phosphate acyltransferase
MTARSTPLGALLGTLGRALYGAYAWLALLVIVIALLPVFVTSRNTGYARRLARRGAQLFFRALGSPVEVLSGSSPMPSPCVVVANHSSYLDGIILTAVLPPTFTFVIKHEMAQVPIASLVLRRLGSEFVRRGDDRHRHRTARKLYVAARRGAALAFFPEGTFDEAPGLKPFQLGAFAAACHAGLPVLPVVIHGARSKLAAERWLPAPGPLAVRLCPPLEPAAYGSVTELMHASRQAILEHLDEPDAIEPATPLVTARPGRPAVDP